MTSKKGGYAIVDVTELTYAKALELLECGKPLLVINDSTNTPYYADSIALDGTDVVIGKGGRTITIETDGDVVATGTIVASPELYMHNLEFTYEDDNIEIYGAFTYYLSTSEKIDTGAKFLTLLNSITTTNQSVLPTIWQKGAGTEIAYKLNLLSSKWHLKNNSSVDVNLTDNVANLSCKDIVYKVL